VPDGEYLFYDATTSDSNKGRTFPKEVIDNITIQ
jgi:hypothetical protein